MPNEAEQELIAGVMTSDWLGCGLLGQEKGTEWLTVEQGGQRQVGKHSVGDGAEEAGLASGENSEELYSAVQMCVDGHMFLPKIVIILFHVNASSY